MSTVEEGVFYRLLDFYKLNSKMVIHSAHPPSGKTYVGAEIRLPKLTADGSRTRDRNHIDYIIQVGPVLILQELKGAASQSGADIDKLHTIISAFGLDGLQRIMKLRVHRPDLLSELRYVVPALGYQNHDATLPEDFLSIQAVSDGTFIVRIGSSLNPRARATIQDCFSIS